MQSDTEGYRITLRLYKDYRCLLEKYKYFVGFTDFVENDRIQLNIVLTGEDAIKWKRFKEEIGVKHNSEALRVLLTKCGGGE